MLLVALVVAASAGVFVDGDAALALVDQGALVLDTRGTWPYLTGHVPGAVSVSWRVGVSGGLRSGLADSPTVVAAAYASRGVSAERAVLVVGAWDAGWGEEGRVAWDLLWLGHPRVFILEGGFAAWPGAQQRWPSRASAASFTPQPRAELRASRGEVLDYDVILDVREPTEFDGANPHFAARGGRVPGARSAPWRSVLAGDLPDLPPGASVVAYCTGGVRSALVTLYLRERGVNVANYDGSWWQWAAD